MARPWHRKLWGVVFVSAKSKPILIGAAWHSFKRTDFYPGEPSRCLLFNTRREAEAFVKVKNAEYKAHAAMNKWRMRVVRVAESVRIV